MPKLEIATSKTRPRPHFASHTQSSLMKTRTPMKLKRKSLFEEVNESKKSQTNVLKLNGICKKRNSVTKQSRSMQMLIMVLKQQRDRRGTIFLSGDKLTGTTCKLKNSLVSLQGDLIKDVSRDLKNCASSPAKSPILHDKSIKVVNESLETFHAEELRVSSQERMNCAERDNSDDTHNSSEARAIIDVTYKLQVHLNDEEKSLDSRCEVEDCRTESGEKPDLPNKDYFEIKTQVQPQAVNIATNYKRTRKTWAFRKVKTQNERVDIDRGCRVDLQDSKGTKFTKHADTVVNNYTTTMRKRGAFQKNFSFNQRAWRPPGVPTTWITESTTSLQPMSQKSSQSSERLTASMKSKHSSTECTKSFNSESTSTSISTNQSKMLMKENRDPRANRTTKVHEHLAEAKQQHRLQGGGTFLKKRQSRTKIGSKVLDKRDDINPTLQKSKSRHCQTVIPKKSANNSNNVKQHHTESTLICNRSRTLEVIHTLRKIIDAVRENDDAEENAVKNNDFNHEKDDDKIQTSPNSDTPQNNELNIFTKDVNLDEAEYLDEAFHHDQVSHQSRRSISTQTKLDSPSYHEIDTEKDQDLTEILNLTRIVATQTLPSCNKNLIETGCNTSNIICNDVEVSCYLIGSTHLKAKVEPTIEDESTSDIPIHTEHSFVEHIEIEVENEDTNENKEFLFNECKTLNTEMSLKLENCGNTEISAKTTNDAAEETEKIMHEKDQISLKLFKNSDDKTNTDENQESTKCSNNHNVSNTSVNLFVERSRSSTYDYNASCSSEEVVEHLENDVQHKDMVTSELKMEDIPSDVIAAFELATERGRNLREAIIIYHENLMSRESERRSKKTVEDYKSSKFHDDQKYASFISREDEDKIKSECEAICHFTNNGEDFGGFSTCSSRGSSSDLINGSEFPTLSNDDHFGIEREEESIIFSESEQVVARSALNECSDLEDVKSLMQMMVHRTEEEYALELLESERDDESFEMERIKNNKILALPTTTEKTSLISRENLLLFICCIICCIAVFWMYMQFLFRCDSTK